MLKEKDNPPLSYPEGVSVRDFSGRWWVAHTKSRNEKALAQDLLIQNIQYFLPMSWNIRRMRERTFKSLLPVFSGYMFFCCDDFQRTEVMRTNRVAGILDVADQAHLVTELTQIEMALLSGVPMVPHQYLKTGQWCRVTAGPLMGLEGIVVKMKNVMRLILQIDMLGQATSVEIDITMIEPISDPAHETDADG